MIYVLSGPNSFLLQERKKELIERFVTEHGSLALEELDGADATLDRLQESLHSLPFLASKKLVVLHAPSLNKDFIEAHKSLLEGVSDSTDTILIEPKLDKRSGYYKYVKKLDGFEEFPELDPAGVARWAQDYVKKWDATLEPAAARELINRAGVDQMKLKHELDKLSMFRAKIDVDAVRQLTVATPSSTIFELVEAAFSDNKQRALKLYDEQRALNVDPLQIVAMLAWQFHVLALIVTAKGASLSDIASSAKLNPYVVQKSSAIARRLSDRRVRELIHELRMLDEASKSTRINMDDALKSYILSI